MCVKEACERLWKKTCKPNCVLSNRVLSKRISNETNRVLSKRISNETNRVLPNRVLSNRVLTNFVLSNRIVCNLYNKVNGRVYKSLC